MTLESSDKSVTASGQPADTSAHMRAEVDVINRLALVNPANTTMPELYGMPKSVHYSEVSNMLNDFEILDAKDFMKGVHGLSDRAAAKNVPLNKEFLDKEKDDVQIGKQERGVARIMSENFWEYTNAVDDSPAKSYLKLQYQVLRYPQGSPDLVLSDKDIARMDSAADAIENSKKHPEMRDASKLAEAAQSILDKNGGQTLSQVHLRNVVFNSSKYTPEERAAAGILGTNIAKFEQMGSNFTGIDKNDIKALSELGAPKPEKDASAKNESCPKESASGNALAWGVAVGVLSLATGSKHAMRNAVVAAGSGAAAAEIKNSLECGNKK